MKKLLVFLFFTFSGLLLTPCIAQFNVYFPFPNTNATWMEDNWMQLSTFTCSPPTLVTVYQYFDYYVNGDTIVNGKTYFKLRTSGGYRFSFPCPLGEEWYSFDSLECLLREDTAAEKVYVSFAPNLGVDVLLYDFSLAQGDYLPYTYNSISDSNFVKSIDSVLVGSKYRKQFNIGRSKSDPIQIAQIIEGIGSSRGLLTPLAFPFESGVSLDCFNNASVYFPSGDTCNRFVLSTPQIKNPEPTFTVYPNPNKGVFSVICHSEQSEESLPIINVYNILGELVLTETLRSAQGDNTIDLSSQANGVYLYRVISDSGSLIGEGKLIIQK